MGDVDLFEAVLRKVDCLDHWQPLEVNCPQLIRPEGDRVQLWQRGERELLDLVLADVEGFEVGQVGEGESSKAISVGIHVLQSVDFVEVHVSQFVIIEAQLLQLWGVVEPEAFELAVDDGHRPESRQDLDGQRLNLYLTDLEGRQPLEIDKLDPLDGVSIQLELLQGFELLHRALLDEVLSQVERDERGKVFQLAHFDLIVLNIELEKGREVLHFDLLDLVEGKVDYLNQRGLPEIDRSDLVALNVQHLQKGEAGELDLDKQVARSDELLKFG